MPVLTPPLPPLPSHHSHSPCMACLLLVRSWDRAQKASSSFRYMSRIAAI